MEKCNHVLLVAGTHGNELSGIYLHKLIRERLYDASRSTFSTDLTLANPEAVQQNVRYIDSDLNREFSTDHNPEPHATHERKLAQKIGAETAKAETQLVIDLHNTTSNMGATLILLSDSLFYKRMGAYVKQRMPEANILFESRKPWNEQPYLCTSGQYGVMIEVGSQAHGSLKFDTLELMKEMLTAVLDYLESHNLNEMMELKDYCAFNYIKEVAIPLDRDGMRIATVHPTICGKDFEVVKQGEPLLATFFGYDIYWEGSHDVYPHFINESAYCMANIAMALAEKRLVSVT
ncbi:aspartoacylase [Vibrio paucivorans]|uniref:Aspartoacylase n=1 Tax=Vibrio paucivorans TaxID=2829489 RepID=A0A9X3HU06_9VIBR|nr:aspartoacylase [Vibrio paucivorans]MCW8336355.1 aspartoacylase [Vibrio paucivorans]